jgi:tRNA(Ser,Leu) C12 N-acetylase TAN1
VPIDLWTAPDLESMKQAVMALGDRIAAGETWRTTVERRPGAALDREEVIRTLARLVPAKVDLTHPDKILLVELFVDRVGLAVVTRDEVLAVAATARPTAESPGPAPGPGGGGAPASAPGRPTP